MNAPRRSAGSAGFSLIEVVLSLAVISFAFLTTVALLPMGVKDNRITAEETRAACILTLLESDLRNTHPLANGGKSKYFGLALPYAANASGQVVLNPDLQSNTLSSTYTVGLDDKEKAVDPAQVPPPAYQASVLYTRLPKAGAHTPVEARVIVSWPCRNGTDPALLTSLTHVTGFVESYVTFQAP